MSRERVATTALTLLLAASALIWMGRAIIGVSLGLAVISIVWLFSAPRVIEPPTIFLYLLVVAAQCLHLLEEVLGGFSIRFPRLFGYRWPIADFLTANLIWLAVMVLAAAGALRQVESASLVFMFAAWFGGIFNGIAHLTLCVYEGGYFPGAVTALLLLALGMLLARALIRSPLVSDAGTGPSST